MTDINYLLVLLAAFIAIASPGPATIAIMGTSMSQGRLHGTLLALGVLSGSLFWSCSAAFGLGAIMHTNVWIFEILRYLGAAYLLFLSYKSILSAIKREHFKATAPLQIGIKAYYFRGLLIHLTNPKAILFFGSLYSVIIPTDANTMTLLQVIASVGLVSASVFLGYALIFSNSKICKLYTKSRRYFEAIFAMLFGAAGIKVLASRLEP